jgi:glutamyl-tRNA synthetase
MGGVRTALYNYLFAKKHNGDFILRIEDTDQERFVKGAEEYIIESLKWCGIEPNEGVGFGDGAHAPYRQSERKPLYKQYAEQLIKNGHAYYAFDTKEELEEMRKRIEAAGGNASYNSITRQNMRNSLTLSEDEVKKLLENKAPYVIRLKVPRNEEIKLQDLIRGWVVVNSSQIDDKVLFKADGMPTYHLANVVDDYLMQITHVIRGEEWLPSAPLHVLLYKYLGWEEVMPQFAHLPLLLKPDGNGKLSKRDGDRLGFPVFPLQWTDPVSGEISSGYRERGYFPDAFINMLALLGWHASGNREIFSKEELIQEFSLDRVNKAGAKFDPEKTKWFNQQYLRKRSPEQLAEIWMPELQQKNIKTDTNYIVKVCALLQEKACFVNEFWDLGKYFFEAPGQYDDSVISKKLNPQSATFIKLFTEELIKSTDFSASTIETIFKSCCETRNIKTGEVMQLVRVSITGVSGGPALFEVLALIGKNEVINRLKHFIEKYQVNGL